MLSEGNFRSRGENMLVTKPTANRDSLPTLDLVNMYIATLEKRGYRPTVVQAYRRAVEHFLSWSAPNHESIEVDDVLVQRFLNEHLDHCDCAGRRQRGKVTAQAALRQLLAILPNANIPRLPGTSLKVADSRN
jgi:hypothetical protein